MPSYVIKYNPVSDLKKVAPNGALDLKSAYANKTIPANLQSVDARYNGVDDPRSLIGRVKDPIDAEMIGKEIRKYGDEKLYEKTD